MPPHGFPVSQLLFVPMATSRWTLVARWRNTAGSTSVFAFFDKYLKHSSSVHQILVSEPSQAFPRFSSGSTDNVQTQPDRLSGHRASCVVPIQAIEPELTLRCNGFHRRRH